MRSPTCRLMARASAWSATRTKPPGITCQPSPVRASISRRMKGRGTRLPFSHTGVVDSVTASCATKSTPRRPISSISAARAGASSSLPSTLPRWICAGRSPAKAGAITSSSSRSNTLARALGSPSHQVATLGNLSSLPSNAGASAGRKLSMARASTRPEPSPLASTTWPSRIACTRPGTPRRERAESSSGSAKSASSRRTSTSARFKPATVRTKTPSWRTVRSSPSTSRKPR